MSILRYQSHTPAASAFSPLSRLSAFHHEVDRLLDLPFFSRESSSLEGWSPTLDLYQDKDQFLVKVELAGMKKEDFVLSIHDAVLTLAGERRQEKADGEKGALRNERHFGRFARTVALPTQVDGTRVSASYEDGVLTVVLPKAEAAKPRQIEIGVK